MKDHYIYPALFEYEDDGGMSISFPDMPGCFSCAGSDEEGLEMARDAVGLHLYAMEQDNDPIPSPTPLKDIPGAQNQRAVLIEVHMPLIRQAIESAAIKKTLTLPRWLNTLAEQRNVNFSLVLQDALKEKLGISRKAS
jgi:predicted RNase H-like HicB family nuclease